MAASTEAMSSASGAHCDVRLARRAAYGITASRSPAVATGQDATLWLLRKECARLVLLLCSELNSPQAHTATIEKLKPLEGIRRTPPVPAFRDESYGRPMPREQALVPINNGDPDACPRCGLAIGLKKRKVAATKRCMCGK